MYVCMYVYMYVCMCACVCYMGNVQSYPKECGEMRTYKVGRVD